MKFVATERHGEVSAHLVRPRGARCLLALAHGAGAGMRHPFLDAVADRLAARGVATFRYQFPYMEAGRRRPDPARWLTATVRSAIAAARRTAGDLPLLAGGKSMGGRMTSLAHAAAPLPGVRGLVFLGFPLHPPRRPGTDRAAHLAAIDAPMLFVQGTRDALARLDLIRRVVADLPSAHLHVVDTADHGFRVLRRSGRTDDDAVDEIAGAVAEFCEPLVAAGKSPLAD